MFSLKKPKRDKRLFIAGILDIPQHFVYDTHFIWIFYTLYHLIFMQANPISYFSVHPLTANLLPMKMISTLTYYTFLQRKQE